MEENDVQHLPDVGHLKQKVKYKQLNNNIFYTCIKFYTCIRKMTYFFSSILISLTISFVFLSFNKTFPKE